MNRRKYYRGKITVPARWQLLTEEDSRLVYDGKGRELFKQADLLDPVDEILERAEPGTSEKQILRCLQLLNNKLDFIIEQIFLKEKETPPSRGEVIEISGSGLKFTSEEFLEKGALLLMHLILPGTFEFQLELISEVLRSEDVGRGFVIAAKILEIREETRDEIIKVVLQKQRKEIRTGKTNQGGGTVDCTELG
jgi:hypothetical protein